jgi:hypothetical protein
VQSLRADQGFSAALDPRSIKTFDQDVRSRRSISGVMAIARDGSFLIQLMKPA